MNSQIAGVVDLDMDVFLIAFLKELYDLLCRMVVGIELQVSGTRHLKDCLVNSILQNRGNRLD